MSQNAVGTAVLEEPAVTTLVQLMLADYDELVEADVEHDRWTTLRHTPGKYFPASVNYGFRDLIYYTSEYMVHPDDQNRYLRECDPDRLVVRLRDPACHGVVRDRFRYKLINGGWRMVEQVTVGGAENGMPEGRYYCFLFDVQGGDEPEEKRTEERQADRHKLTGLLWESTFFDLARERAGEGDWCVVAIDLEHFKLFNEWYGRTAGDQLLAQIGGRLARTEKRSGGVACYFGQDDFAILVPYEKAAIERLYDELHGFVKDCGTAVGFMPAFGICPMDGKIPVEEIYDRAAMAARRAKDDYHNRIRVFDPSMYEKTDKDYRILSDFQKALRDHEIYFELQPQCQASTEKVVGAELLVRWKKANGEQVPPGVFVPVLEEYGFVTDLDRYVWEEVCVWQKRWSDAGNPVLPVSVNVSQMDMYAIDVPDCMEQLLEKYQLPPDALKIEIAESAYAASGAVADTIRRLREKGFLVLMDDFGRGYSSLNILRNLNVDIIKLNAKFLRMDSAGDKKGVQIMESIVNMAKTMGVPIIVEGVESREEASFLTKLGCRYMQGYRFYRPMPVEDYEALIGNPRRVDTKGFRFKAKEQFHTREFLDQNVFSDTALNNILGPVAFYSWHGEDVDIVRANQQFRDTLKAMGFPKNTHAIQNRMPPEDAKQLFKLLHQAMRDRTGGSVGQLRINRTDGGISQFRAQFFYLEEDKKGRKFYGSVRDLTEFITLNDHMRLLSRVSTDTVIFARKEDGKWTFRVVIHGLEREMGISREQLEEEYADETFYDRMDRKVQTEILSLTKSVGAGMGTFSDVFELKTEYGTRLPVRVLIYGAHDKNSGVEYILTMRKCE